MIVYCPHCQAEVGSDEINVGADMAHCHRCNQVFRVSPLIEVAEAGEVDLSNPPPGAWFNRDYDGFVVGATTRNAAAWVLIPFAVVWSGLSVGGIYGSQIYEGAFSPTLSLFGIPFLMGTVGLLIAILMCLWGKGEVRVEHGEGHIFTGVGPLGLTRRFRWDEVTAIGLCDISTSYKRQQPRVTLETKSQVISFGIGWSDTRRRFVLAALRQQWGGRPSQPADRRSATRR